MDPDILVRFLVIFSRQGAVRRASLKAWNGKAANVAAGQAALLHRAHMNGLAAKGEYKRDLEKKAA